MLNSLNLSFNFYKGSILLYPKYLASNGYKKNNKLLCLWLLNLETCKHKKFVAFIVVVFVSLSRPGKKVCIVT